MSDDQQRPVQDDILAWAEDQARALRRRAAGEIVNDAELDWPNIAEEIEDVGSNRFTRSSAPRASVAATISRRRRGRCRGRPSWRADARLQRQQARRSSPRMRRYLDLAALYAVAVRALPEELDERRRCRCQRLPGHARGAAGAAAGGRLMARRES